MLDNEQLNSDASTESSSETPEASSQENNAAEGQQAQAASSTKEDNVPFHEHPRFKEVIEQKNQAMQQVQALMARLESLEKRSVAPSQPEKDALLERLKSIDPEFGGRFEQLNSYVKKIEQLENRLQGYESKATEEKINSAFENLCTENKVSQDRRGYYEAMMIRQAQIERSQGRQVTPADMPRLFKQVHDSEAKYLEAIRRAEREAYTKEKTKDAATPQSQPRGKVAPAPKVARQAPRDQADDRRSLVDEVLRTANEMRGKTSDF